VLKSWSITSPNDRWKDCFYRAFAHPNVHVLSSATVAQGLVWSNGVEQCAYRITRMWGALVMIPFGDIHLLWIRPEPEKVFSSRESLGPWSPEIMVAAKEVAEQKPFSVNMHLYEDIKRSWRSIDPKKNVSLSGLPRSSEVSIIVTYLNARDSVSEERGLKYRLFLLTRLQQILKFEDLSGLRPPYGSRLYELDGFHRFNIRFVWKISVEEYSVFITDKSETFGNGMLGVRLSRSSLDESDVWVGIVMAKSVEDYRINVFSGYTPSGESDEVVNFDDVCDVQYRSDELKIGQCLCCE